MAKHIQMPPIYPIPPNWTWVELRKLTQITSGYPFDSKLFSNLPEEGRPLIRIRDIVRGYTETFTSEPCPEQYIIHNNDILIGMDGDFNVGRWHDGDALLNQRVCFIQSISNLLINDYLFYFLPAPLKQINDVTPSVTVKHLSTKTIGSIMIPLPPVEEQLRLIELIDALFSKLDEAKENAQNVVEGFETRKAAILHKAFTGELTAKWREENGVAHLFATKRFDEVAIIKSNLVDPAEYQNYPHIAPDNIEKKTGILMEYRTIAEDNVKSGKHRFYPGQILYSKIRPNLSKVVVVDFDGLCSADMYPIEAIGDTKCLWYFMLSENFLEQASSAGSRSVLPKINQKELSALTVTIPDSIEEQKELSRLIDSLLTKEYHVKDSAETVVDQIDTMKKAILARAFRGELGTNDPTEESAKELLRKIL